MPTANTRKKMVRRGARIVWTYQMRVALHLITSEFDLLGEQRAAVFNDVFAQELSHQGVPEGARARVLYIQYEMRRYPEKYRYWPTIMAAPNSQAEADEREIMRAQIRQVLQHATSSQARSVITLSTLRSPSQPEIEVASQGNGTKVTRVLHTPLRASIRPRPEQTMSPACTPHTPSPTKRPMIDEDDSDLEPQPGNSSFELHRKRARVAERIQPPLLARIGRKGAVSISIPTKSSTSLQKPCSLRGKYVHTRPDGTNIVVSDKRKPVLGQRLVPVPQSIAQPPLPWLLIRYYEEQTPRDHDGEDGFMARKYFQSLPPPLPPNSAYIDLKDVLNHMDRRTQETPFISTCNKLLWIVQLAIKEAQRGVKNGRIAIVDPAIIGKRAIFWAPPFHKEIADKSAEFRNGAYRYCGNYEFLVWGSIPKEAIVTSVKVSDLLNLPELHPVVGQIMRFDVLRTGASLGKKEAELKSHGVQLNGTTAAGIARLAIFLGFTADAPVQHLSHIVADVVRGWQLNVAFREPRAWRRLAVDFARAIAGDLWVEPERQQALKMAFLDGIRWSRGDFNARHRAETMATMQRKARLIGLEFPAKILSEELDSWKTRFFTHDNTVARLLGGDSQQRLMDMGAAGMGEDHRPEDDHENEENSDAGDALLAPGPSRPAWSWVQRMRIEDDGDELDADEGIEYEFDERGRVV